MEQEKVRLQALVGTGATGWNSTDGDFEWTQDKVNEAIRGYEQTLEEIKNGALITVPVGGVSATKAMEPTKEK